MKNASVILNVVLLLAVGVLFYLHFSSKNKYAGITETRVNAAGGSGCRIAYFELDSLTNSFSLIKDIKSELSQEEEKMNGELNNMQKTYNDRLAQYQKQARTMSQVESERANRDMMQLQESMRAKKQEMDQKYQDLYTRKQQEIKSKIEDFLKEYNKSKGYSYILAYEPGIIYYRDTINNITGDLIKGLNEMYKKK